MMVSAAPSVSRSGVGTTRVIFPCRGREREGAARRHGEVGHAADARHRGERHLARAVEPHPRGRGGGRGIIAADAPAVRRVDPQLDAVLARPERGQRQEMALVAEAVAACGAEPDAAGALPVHLDDDLRIGDRGPPRIRRKNRARRDRSRRAGNRCGKAALKPTRRVPPISSWVSMPRSLKVSVWP